MQPPQIDKKAKARAWVNGYTAAGTGIVVAAILPGTTSAALMGIEVTMCYQIGKIYRSDKYTMQEAIAAARVVGLVAIAAQMIALEALDFVPGPGWLVKGGVAGGVIKTLGEAVIKHYEKLEQQADASLPPILSSSPIPLPPPIIQTIGKVSPMIAIEERLRKLSDLFGQNLISQADYDAKRQQILSEL